MDKISGLKAIFEPKSIAVLGASTKVGTVGHSIFSNLITSGYKGVLFPINPKSTSVLGVYSYPSILQIPVNEVDLAVVIIPPQSILKVVEEAAAKKVKGMVVISAGFKETGEKGATLENELKKQAEKAGISIIGPNCLGVINTDPQISMNATFGRNMPKEGNIGFISQSGALCIAVLDYARERKIGFSKFVSYGNKVDINEIDLLDYFGSDPKTSVIAMYLEDVTNGRDLIQTARTVFDKYKKPMLCIKSGRSPEGARAVSSHTGSLAASDSISDALMLQSGIHRVDTIAELFDHALLFSSSQPLPKGNRLGIITNAGGPGVMATDSAVRQGLSLAKLSEVTKNKLASSLPPTAALNNPIDVIGDAHADRYKAAIETVCKDENVDILLILLTHQSMTEVDEVAKTICEELKKSEKTVVCSFMGGENVNSAVDILRRGGIPNYPFPEDAIKSLSVAVKLSNSRKRIDRKYPKFDDIDVDSAKRIIADYLSQSQRRYLTQVECRKIFECYKLNLLRNVLVHSEKEAVEEFEKFNCPVAVKIMSSDVVHKYDIGGVKINVYGANEVREAYISIINNVKKAVPNAVIQGVLIEEMAPKGTEVIVGATRDIRFGPIVMFGLGGVFVEVLKDVSFRLAPMFISSAQRMVEQIRSYKILTGVRGKPAADIHSIIEVILRISTMVCNHPEIMELDINPLIVHAEGQGCHVADSRMILKKTDATTY